MADDTQDQSYINVPAYKDALARVFAGMPQFGGPAQPSSVQPTPDPVTAAVAPQMFGRLRQPFTAQPDQSAQPPMTPVASKGAPVPANDTEVRIPGINDPGVVSTLPDWKTAIPGQNPILRAPAPMYNTPERQTATSMISAPRPTYEQNKPKWYDRLGGAALGAFGGAEVGKSFTDRKMNRAMSEWKDTTKQGKDILAEQDKSYGAQEKGWRDALTQGYREETAAEKARHNQSEESLRSSLNDTKQQLADQNNPANKVKATWAQRRAEITELNSDPKTKLTPDKEKYYLANGKLKEPDPYAEEKLALMRERLDNAENNKKDRQSEKADNQTQREHDKWTAGKQKIESDQQHEYDKLENFYGRQFDKAENDNDRNAITKELTQKKADLERSIQQRYTDLGPEPGAKQNSLPAAAPANANQPAQKTATKAEIRAFVAAHPGRSYQQVLEGLKAKNYIIK